MFLTPTRLITLSKSYLSRDWFQGKSSGFVTHGHYSIQISVPYLNTLHLSENISTLQLFGRYREMWKKLSSSSGSVKKKKNSLSIWATEIGQWSWQFLDGWVKVWQLITVVNLSLSAINSCLSTDYTILDVLMRVPLKTAKCLYGFMKHTANPNLGLGFTISFLYVWSGDLYRGKSVHS